MNPFREQRMKALAEGDAPVRPAGRFRAELVSDGGDLWLYDVIDPWGGYWGISAAEIVQALQGLGGGPVTVHMNSGGGDVFEAISMHSTIAAYTGQTTVVVEGLAASAASMLLTAFDRVEVVPNAQVMIHDAWSYEAGDEAAMLKAAELLGRTSANMATAYQAKAGGDVGEWRARMKATTWYIGSAEIIGSGLADGLVATSSVPSEQQMEEAFARWDLSIYGTVPDRAIRKPDSVPGKETSAPVASTVDDTGIIPVELPVFSNLFASLRTTPPAPAATAAEPEFGNKFREALKELTT